MTIFQYLKYMGKIEDFAKKVYEKSQSRNIWVTETPEWSFVDGKKKS